jgi:hypothetical protein
MNYNGDCIRDNNDAKRASPSVVVTRNLRQKETQNHDRGVTKKMPRHQGGMRWQGMQHKEEVTTCAVERETRLELATPTLARLCSTN